MMSLQLANSVPPHVLATLRSADLVCHVTNCVVVDDTSIVVFIRSNVYQKSLPALIASKEFISLSCEGDHTGLNFVRRPVK